MKKIISLVFLLCISCLHSMAARVAPTLPSFTSLESGKDYCLYNVETGKFLNYSYDEGGSTCACLEREGKRFTFTKQENGSYTIKLTQSTAYNSYLRLGDVSIGSWITVDTFNVHHSWNIATAGDNAYTIRLDSFSDEYNATYRLGSKVGDSIAHVNCSSTDNTTWKLMDGEKTEIYFGRVNLYNALEAASVALNGKNYNIEKFEAIYDNISSTAAELNAAASILKNSVSATLSYTFPEWNDYPIFLELPNDNKWSIGWNCVNNEDVNNVVNFSGVQDTTSTLTATVVLDGDATLCYRVDNGCEIKLIVDNVECKTFAADKLNGNSSRKLFYELSSGKHSIQWTATSKGSCGVLDIGIEKTPMISVNLAEPGSLGTEILYNVDYIKDVRRLKIKGLMNDSDWQTIGLIKDNLFALDLSEAKFTSIPDNTFRSNASFLHAVKLPETLTSIGNSAFDGTPLDSINMPSSLRSIGSSSFSGTNITKAILPESCTSVGNAAFGYCLFLKKVKLSNSLSKIPYEMFEFCKSLETFALPDSLTEIGEWAFIGANDFGKGEKLTVTKKVTYIGGDAFRETGFTSAELPMNFYQVTGNHFLPSSITTIKLNSPTVVGFAEHVGSIIVDDNLSNVTLIVPSYLVNSYKLDSYWYNCAEVTGFDTKEISDWTINKSLVLSAHDRFNGTPSIDVATGVTFKINGTDGMDINNFSYGINPESSSYSQIIINPDDVVVKGNLWTRYYKENYGSGKWSFISLPYSMKVGDIKGIDNDSKFAIRYYDGASRAANGAVGNWKNLTANDTIPAGSGFIFYVNQSGWWKFPSMNNADKQFIMSNKVFVKALAANHSDIAANSGWNLIGNPYQCWYNIHKLNFTAPITVCEKGSYAAYSIIDDDYAIAPNQAFFVQCPDGISEISFPLDGRQLTSDIQTQSGVKALSSAKRALIDLTVSNGKKSDRTRVVLNDKASEAYETSCDAAKFLSESDSVPQLYSYDADGTKYAINERPENNGIVKLTFVAPESGCFSMSLTRNSASKVLLVDNEKSQTIDLTEGDYNFTADAGTFADRFELRLSGNNEATGVETLSKDLSAEVKAVTGGVNISGTEGVAEVFSADGKSMSKRTMTTGTDGFIALPNGKYVVTVNGKSTKVVVY